MDVGEQFGEESTDVPHGAIIDDETTAKSKLLALATATQGLTGADDNKLSLLLKVAKELIDDGFSPIIFCRYIQTAEYVAEQMRIRLRGVEVACITGQLPHDERESRVAELGQKDKKILVCTDCLSEGINLQEWFDAVVHADLAWSPTRHEQREGRVDRFNQKSKNVRVITLFGEDNPVDGIVLNILLKKHKKIRNALGVSVPVPSNSDKVLEAIFEALLMRGDQSIEQLNLFADFETNESKALDNEWRRAADREKASRTIFAQHSMKASELEPEIAEIRRLLGKSSDIRQFFFDVVRASGGTVQEGETATIQLLTTPLAFQDAVKSGTQIKVEFEPPVSKGALLLSRTHPIIESVASYVMDSALSDDPNSIAKRCGVIASSAVQEMTILMLLRFRFQIESKGRSLLAEDMAVAGFTGVPANCRWLDEEEAERLLQSDASGNIGADHSRGILETLLNNFDQLEDDLVKMAERRAKLALDSHRRVRKTHKESSAATSVKVQGSPDVIGVYVLFPNARGGS